MKMPHIARAQATQQVAYTQSCLPPASPSAHMWGHAGNDDDEGK